jgi:hypothetical protein
MILQDSFYDGCRCNFDPSISINEFFSKSDYGLTNYIFFHKSYRFYTNFLQFFNSQVSGYPYSKKLKYIKEI